MPQNTKLKRHGIIVLPTNDLGATFNPSVIKLDKKNYVMLVRSVPKGYKKIGPVNGFNSDYTSHLSLWRGTSPIEFELDEPHSVMPDKCFDRYGVEDPRITKIGDTYYVLYTSLSIGLGEYNPGDGIRISMASTTDFITYKKHGIIGPDRRSKAGTIFKTNGKVYLLWKDEKTADKKPRERTMLTIAPENFNDSQAWAEMWKKRNLENDVLISAQNNTYENYGIEPGAPPIEVDDGLLLVYSSISKDKKWTISFMTLDKNDPTKIISKTIAPCLVPEEDYELYGDVNNVIFPCGAIIDDDRLYIYYGCADTFCAVASMDMNDVNNALKPFENDPVESI